MMTYWRRNPALKFKRNDPRKCAYLLREDSQTGETWCYDRVNNGRGVKDKQLGVANRRRGAVRTFVPITSRQFYRKLNRLRKRVGYSVQRTINANILDLLKDHYNQAYVTINADPIAAAPFNVDITLKPARALENIELNLIV